MARGRMLAKKLSTSQKFAQLFEVCPDLAEFTQTLYPLLVAHADDFGRQQGDVFTVRHSVHPTSPRGAKDFERALQALHDVGLIVWYEARGRRCIQITKFDENQQGLHKRTRSEFPAAPGNSRENPDQAEFSLNCPDQENRTEEKRTEPNRTEGKGEAAAPQALADLWNELTTAPLPPCQELSDQRKRKAIARLKERSLEEWRAIISRIEASSFCRGETGAGDWVASFDFLLKPDTAVKVLEGKYDDRKAAKPSRNGRGPVVGSPEYYALARAARGEQ